MATIEKNKLVWDEEYDWPEEGDEWSQAWGSAELQWHSSLIPRILKYIPVNTILEIAPGQGRWTQFLKNYCKSLKIVDISNNCIEHCKERFASDNHIEFYTNDGTTLDMIADKSVDFIFSFDSLVHAEFETMKSYLSEFSRVIKPQGIIFIHHSNLGNYPELTKKETAFKYYMEKYRIFKKVDIGWRSKSVTYQNIRNVCEEFELKCVFQELTNWEGTQHYLIDCISVIVPKESHNSTNYKLLQNPDLISNAQYVKNIGNHYQF